MGTFHSGTLYNLFLLRNQFGDIGCPQMGRPHIATLEERIVMANLQWSLQPSLKAQFITEIEMLPMRIKIACLCKT